MSTLDILCPPGLLGSGKFQHVLQLTGTGIVEHLFDGTLNHRTELTWLCPERALTRLKLLYRPSVGVPAATIAAAGPVADAINERLGISDHEALSRILHLVFVNLPACQPTTPASRPARTATDIHHVYHMSIMRNIILLLAVLAFSPALALDAERHGPVTAPTITLQGSGSTGEISDMSVKTVGGNVARSLASHARDNGFNVLDFGVNVGMGGDDSTALNAAVSAAIASGGASKLVFPPAPSGFYNVCAAPFNIVPGGAAGTNLPVNLTIEGASSGASTIRTLPGCSNLDVQDHTVFVSMSGTVNPITNSRIFINNMRFDGYCTSKYTIKVNYAIGMTIRNTVIRNAGYQKGGANLYLPANSYHFDIDRSVWLENQNDPGHACYGSYNDLPDYNLEVHSTDSLLAPIAVNAKTANYYQAEGGVNTFSAAHGWGYAPDENGSPDLRPAWTYLINGKANLLGPVADGPRLGGFSFINTVNSLGGPTLVGGIVLGPSGAGAVGLKIAPAVKNALIINNDFGSAPAAPNAIDTTGGLDATNIIRGNSGSPINTNLTVSQPGGDTLTLSGLASGAGATVGASGASGSATLYVRAQGTGAVNLQSGGVNALSASNPVGAANSLSVRGNFAGYPIFVFPSGSDTNIQLYLNGKGSYGVVTAMHSLSSDPTTSIIDPGHCMDWTNTNTGATKHWCNVAGTLKSVTLK